MAHDDSHWDLKFERDSERERPTPRRRPQLIASGTIRNMFEPSDVSVPDPHTPEWLRLLRESGAI